MSVKHTRRSKGRGALVVGGVAACFLLLMLGIIQGHASGTRRIASPRTPEERASNWALQTAEFLITSPFILGYKVERVTFEEGSCGREIDTTRPRSRLNGDHQVVLTTRGLFGVELGEYLITCEGARGINETAG